MVRYLDLQSFIVRARVLKLYRQALRTARRAPTNARGQSATYVLLFLLSTLLFYDKLATAEESMIPADELRQTMREEIEKNRYCDDKQKIRFLISEGLQRLKGLDEMLDMMGHS